MVWSKISSLMKTWSRDGFLPAASCAMRSFVKYYFHHSYSSLIKKGCMASRISVFSHNRYLSKSYFQIISNLKDWLFNRLERDCWEETAVKNCLTADLPNFQIVCRLDLLIILKILVRITIAKNNFLILYLVHQVSCEYHIHPAVYVKSLFP